LLFLSLVTRHFFSIRHSLEFLIAEERAAFIGVDEGEHRLNFRTASHAGFLFPALQDFRELIVPTALPHEFVPNVDFVLCRTVPHAKAPLQNFIVRSAFLHAIDQAMVIDAQKAAAGRIESAAKVRLIIGRELSFVVLPNFVDHPPEINDAADFFRRTAQA
jgi:hypothetical protein